MTDLPGDMFQLSTLAARCRRVLDDDAPAEIASFLRSQQNPDGGFRNRAGHSDLYYTYFALEALFALDESLPLGPVKAYLASRRVADFDLVHLVCFLRTAMRVGLVADARTRAVLLEGWRTTDGGYSERRGAENASPYGCFLATLAYDSVGRPVPREDDLKSCLPSCGAATTPQAAALLVLRAALTGAKDAGLTRWVLDRYDPIGGFRVSPQASLPDLLSTAVALHALRLRHHPVDAFRDPCFAFITSLWDEAGGFCGHPADNVPDCEYTYYGLLALGALA